LTFEADGGRDVTNQGIMFKQKGQVFFADEGKGRGEVGGTAARRVKNFLISISCWDITSSMRGTDGA
jgi:hypothetical protein